MSEHPGNARFATTAIPDLSGRTAIVTGASGGLGAETARSLARMGAHVIFAVRDVVKGRDIVARTPGNSEVRWLDLSDLASVHAFADTVTEPVDILINNAGIMAVPLARTVDGFELQIGTNHLGHFALTQLLLPLVRDRVVTVSSQLHRRGRIDLRDLNWERRRYDPLGAYSASKLANVLFTFELQRNLDQAGSPVRAVTAHPGIASTQLARRAGGASALIDRYLGWAFNDARQGALSILYAATQDVPRGAYVGPLGLGHLRGRPGVHHPSKASQDPAMAYELWELSAALTKTMPTALPVAAHGGQPEPRGSRSVHVS
jgi:NAD(P)-dependent dehydrogenase (short-subunit alcohol dehydrogenase family)